mmetsp:Transcript_7896/g.15497  ORF Transcript_7896/g.15497 Transcript_7896/m.15497 type:complete len:97 (-) Transcript_7896:1315-1605(-)
MVRELTKLTENLGYSKLERIPNREHPFLEAVTKSKASLEQPLFQHSHRHHKKVLQFLSVTSTNNGQQPSREVQHCLTECLLRHPEIPLSSKSVQQT